MFELEGCAPQLDAISPDGFKDCLVVLIRRNRKIATWLHLAINQTLIEFGKKYSAVFEAKVLHIERVVYSFVDDLMHVSANLPSRSQSRMLSLVIVINLLSFLVFAFDDKSQAISIRFAVGRDDCPGIKNLI